MLYTYQPKGVCSTEITFEIADGVVKNVKFTGGCRGNLTAISRLLEGLPAQEVISKMKGITCRPSGASCADQLACALEKAINS
ncbi:hypothetical protein Ga0466249_001470 [Sporomusaceae bacterium BoRhaA]|uniref:TIGR03905 family TSCPD domain-containing protein n=1 Tax=Pelorhabdus rhamnosifermentans TaxID=2772457 RepID=UPI001C0630F2|nr:TIGR03905 family TSCPD domain-containing protein [Pelorhabdus rhamnosifermentans]MBU2700378.1 hypothetical protein [Pelorhabdus rhamnosifermentans]